MDQQSVCEILLKVVVVPIDNRGVFRRAWLLNWPHTFTLFSQAVDLSQATILNYKLAPSYVQCQVMIRIATSALQVESEVV